MKPADIEKKSKDLYFITLFPPINGFDNFIGVWVKTGHPSYIIDVGPAVTVTELKSALDQLDISRLDFIFITHIHLDHAGGLGDFSALFPKTPVVCHNAATPHLVDPSRLWEGSQKTLGDMARSYGPPAPVDASVLVDASRFGDGDVTPMITPGHAPHHVSYMTPQCLFAGETCGVHLNLPGGKDYLRPATPPKFYLETAVRSIDLLLEQRPENLCFGHHGMEKQGAAWLKRHRKQLLLWENVIREELAMGDDDTLFSRCMDALKRKDPMLANFNLLNPGEKERETYFITNSIKGFKDHIESSTT